MKIFYIFLVCLVCEAVQDKDKVSTPIPKYFNSQPRAIIVNGDTLQIK